MKTKLNLSELEIAPVTEEDAKEIAELTQLVYGKDIGAEPQDVLDWVHIFPEGQIRIKYQGKIVANSSSLIVNFDDYGPQHTLAEITDEYKITNHNPNGDTLYGFDITVHPDYRRKGLAGMLYQARQDVCRKFNLKRIMFGGRIPGYHQYANHLSPWEYVQQVVDGKLADQVLSFQLKNGFKVIDIIHNYLPEDEESRGYATLMEWRNDAYVE